MTYPRFFNRRLLTYSPAIFVTLCIMIPDFYQDHLRFKTQQQVVSNLRSNTDSISTENYDLIFSKFFRADSSDTRTTGGTGLALALSEDSVVQIDDTIDFESRRGKGLTFFFDLRVQKRGTG